SKRARPGATGGRNRDERPLQAAPPLPLVQGTARRARGGLPGGRGVLRGHAIASHLSGPERRGRGSRCRTRAGARYCERYKALILPQVVFSTAVAGASALACVVA